MLTSGVVVAEVPVWYLHVVVDDAVDLGTLLLLRCHKYVVLANWANLDRVVACLRSRMDVDDDGKVQQQRVDTAMQPVRVWTWKECDG